MANDPEKYLEGQSAPPLSSRRSGLRPGVRASGGERLFLEQRGRGTDVVLVHGAAIAPAHLRPLAELLASSFRVILVHRPGYGSSDPILPYDADTSVERIEAALIQEEVHRPFLVGVSIGAAQCMSMAVRGRIDPRGVVMLGAPNYGSDARRSARAIARTLRAGGDVRGTLASRMLGGRHLDELRAIAEVRSWLTATRLQNLADELVAVADDGRDYRAELTVLGIPTMIRLGSDDRMMSSDFPSSTEQLMPNARIDRVAGCGHSLLVEDFTQTAAAVQEFLLQHTRGSLAND